MKALKLSNTEMILVERLRKSLTNRELCNHINAQRPDNKKFGYTSFRMFLYKKNIRKCEMRRWEKGETKLLLDNYKTKGNIEIAKILSKKGRRFTEKQVQKKIRLMKIKRTKSELNLIMEMHKKKGTYSIANFKKWALRKIPEGSTKIKIVNGRPQVVIKINGGLKAYSRVRYAQLHGKIPKGHIIYFKDMNPLNIEDNNLGCRKRQGLSVDEKSLYNKNCSAYFNNLIKKESHKKIEQPKPKEQQQILISVRVNSRTIVCVKPGTNIQKLKEKYALRTY